MPIRVIVAYILIAVVLAFITSMIVWFRRKSPARSYARDRKRQRERALAAAATAALGK